jgi:hypothetical protein
VADIGWAWLGLSGGGVSTLDVGLGGGLAAGLGAGFGAGADVGASVTEFPAEESVVAGHLIVLVGQEAQLTVRSAMHEMGGGPLSGDATGADVVPAAVMALAAG